MTRYSGALQTLAPAHDGEWGNLVIGNSRFADDVWDLSPFITAPTEKPSDKLIYFHRFECPAIQFVIKQFAYYKLGQVKPQTVRRIVVGSLQNFSRYCRENAIISFADVSLTVFKDYIRWLREGVASKTITGNHAYKCCIAVEEILCQGQVQGWDVSTAYVKGLSIATWIKLIKKEKEDNKQQPIPGTVLNKILAAAKHKEQNVVVKSAIIVQSQTGLRISEVLSLQVGCVQETNEGHPFIEVWIRKTEKDEAAKHRVFVKPWVVETIKELESATMELRRATQEEVKAKIQTVKTNPILSDVERNKAIAEIEREDISRCLFIHKPSGSKGAIVPKASYWNALQLTPFIERWDIRGDDSELYDLKSHQFRHTFVCSLIEQKVPLSFIMKHLSHVSVEMTNYYHSLNEEATKAELAEKILYPNSKIAGKRAAEIREQTAPLFKGKTTEEINDIVKDLADSLNFNTLPTGVCIYDEIRGRCTDGDGCFFYNCPNYVTSEDFYPLLKMELEMKERELARYAALGRKRDYDRVDIEVIHLRPLVAELEAQNCDRKEV